MKRLAMALAATAALTFVPSQTRADEGVKADTSSGLKVTTAVYRPSEDSAKVTDVRWGRYRYGSYYPRYYGGYYPRYSYGYSPYRYNYGYYPRYNYSYRYNYGYPYSYRYSYRYGNPGISFGFRF